MRKALLISMEEKRNKKSQASLIPQDKRLDYLLELLKFSKGFKKDKTEEPWTVNNFTLSRKG